MLPIDLVKSGKARNNSFRKADVSLEGFFQVLIGGYPQKSGIKTFEIQYEDKQMNADLLSKQNGLPASLFVEINWNDNTIRTFFARQPTMGDGFYQDHRTPFYTFSTSVDNPAGPAYGHNGIEHYDYPAIKHGSDDGAFLEGLTTIANTKRPHTHEPRHNERGAFAQWLENGIQRLSDRQFELMRFEVFHVDTHRRSHILNWKQGLKWMLEMQGPKWMYKL